LFVADGEEGGLGAVLHAELGQHRAHVRLHRLVGDAESRRDRASDPLENGFKRYFWKSLFGTSIDGLAIQASLSDSPTHLRDSVCGAGRAKTTRRRSVRSKTKLRGRDARRHR